MRNRKLALFIALILSVIVLISPHVSFALTGAQQTELNNATPGTQKAGLGTLLSGYFSTTVRELVTSDNSFTVANTAYVRKRTSANNDGTALGTGTQGQIITFALVSDGGGTYTITPDTSSGFDQVILQNRGDNVTLRYIDSTVGWIIIGLGTDDNGKVVAQTPNLE